MHWVLSIVFVSRNCPTACGMQLAACVVRVDMHLRALRQLDGPIVFAHADLSGVFGV
jgi:hypothetical protein